MPKIFSSHMTQSSMLLAHSSQATRCRHGRNRVCTRVRLHLRQVISARNRSFSCFNFALSKTTNVQELAFQKYYTRRASIQHSKHVIHTALRTPLCITGFSLSALRLLLTGCSTQILLTITYLQRVLLFILLRHIN